ncbi:MAG: anti-sigma factor family protein [Archangium sp.]
MTHEEAEAELSAWLDGELEPAKAEEVGALVASDAKLSALAAKLKQSRELLASLDSPEPSPRLRANVLSAIAAPVPAPWWKSWLTIPRVSLGALAAVALISALLWKQPDLDEEKLLVAQNLELLEDYEVMSLRDSEDLEVIAAMKELQEATP